MKKKKLLKMRIKMRIKKVLLLNIIEIFISNISRTHFVFKSCIPNACYFIKDFFFGILYSS